MSLALVPILLLVTGAAPSAQSDPAGKSANIRATATATATASVTIIQAPTARQAIAEQLRQRKDDQRLYRQDIRLHRRENGAVLVEYR